MPYGFQLDNFSLGNWVSRVRHEKESISPERKQRIDDIGFIWDVFSETWEDGFSKLKQFKEAEGHCRVPAVCKLDGFNLGTWVETQRSNKDRMPPEREQRLDDLGFIWSTRK